MAGGSFFEGVRTGQALMDNRANQRRADIELDLRYQQLKSQEALRRVHERAAVQEMELQLEKRNQQIQFGADMQKALSATQMEISPIIPMPTPMGILPMQNPSQQDPSLAMVRNVGQVIAKYQPEKYADFVTDVALRRAQIEREKRLGQSLGAGGSEPEMKTVTDEATGKSVTLYRSGPNSWSKVPPTLSEPRATTVQDPVSKNPMTYVQTGPSSFSRVPPSTGQQQLEQTEIASGNVFEQGRRLLPMINEKTTGIRGGVQRALVSSGLGLFVPKMVDPSVSEADAVAREFASGVVRGLRSDGNINKDEQQKLDSEANTLQWVDERTGKSRLKAFVKGAVMKARDASLRLGRPINEKYLTLDELGKRAEAKVEAGEMTREQAMDWAITAHQNSAEAFINDIEQQIGK
jgi:hypothetical protein